MTSLKCFRHYILSDFVIYALLFIFFTGFSFLHLAFITEADFH